MTLALRGSVRLPAHGEGGFDHGDVHLPTGRVFVAHTANGTVEVIDGERLALERTLPGCSEGSGVLCTADETSVVFAAARGEGSVLVFDSDLCRAGADASRTTAEWPGVGPRPRAVAGGGCRGTYRAAARFGHRCERRGRRSARTSALVRLRCPARPLPREYSGARVRGGARRRQPRGRWRASTGSRPVRTASISTDPAIGRLWPATLASSPCSTWPRIVSSDECRSRASQMQSGIARRPNVCTLRSANRAWSTWSTAARSPSSNRSQPKKAPTRPPSTASASGCMCFCRGDVRRLCLKRSAESGAQGVFSVAQLLVSAVVGAVVSLVAVAAYGRWSKQAAFGWGEAVLLAVVVGLSILLWRAAGNTQSLNACPGAAQPTWCCVGRGEFFSPPPGGGPSGGPSPRGGRGGAALLTLVFWGVWGEYIGGPGKNGGRRGAGHNGLSQPPFPGRGVLLEIAR